MSDHDDPVPASIRELMDTFDTLLRDVRFPGVDRQVLERLAAGVRERDAEVGAARAALEAATGALEAARAELRRCALTGLAYAKVYGESDPALGEQLAKIGLGRAAKPRGERKATPPASRRRGSARRAADTVAPLPFEPAEATG